MPVFQREIDPLTAHSEKLSSKQIISSERLKSWTSKISPRQGKTGVQRQEKENGMVKTFCKSSALVVFAWWICLLCCRFSLYFINSILLPAFVPKFLCSNVLLLDWFYDKLKTKVRVHFGFFKHCKAFLRRNRDGLISWPFHVSPKQF